MGESNWGTIGHRLFFLKSSGTQTDFKFDLFISEYFFLLTHSVVFGIPAIAMYLEYRLILHVYPVVGHLSCIQTLDICRSHEATKPLDLAFNFEEGHLQKN